MDSYPAGQVPPPASIPPSALQLYAAILDDILEKALAVVEWAEESKREFEAVTSRGESGNAAE